jgi:DNA repair protein RecN (Recombination protein N)
VLRRLALRDFVIVPALELEFHAGFSVLTGETGAGKSILVDALQLALGSRGDAGVVREGTPRAEVSVEFDSPSTLVGWLDQAGFATEANAEPPTLLLRRTIDAAGKSRAWINGSPATLAQLRQVADQLLDIHGQHAWQSLTRAAATRELVDVQAGLNTRELGALFAQRKACADALALARGRGDEIARERDRLAWQIAEIDKLAPGEGEWAELSAEHQRLAHAQALMDAARSALDAVADADTATAESLTSRAADILASVAHHDPRVAEVVETLSAVLAQLQDAAHTLNSYLRRADLDPERLADLDQRLAAWMSLARRYRRPADQLPALLKQWRDELAALDAAADTAALQAALDRADRHYLEEARRISAARQAAAAPLARAVTEAMQGLGLGGGRFEVALVPLAQPQSQGLEAVEFLVAGHAGSTPRPLGRVASGGELSRLALAIAVTTLNRTAKPADDAPGQPEATDAGTASTLIFDEIDAGIGGAVGNTVGILLKQLSGQHQVLAVTHLAQVAACADHHYVVSKALQADGRTTSTVLPVLGGARVAEVARMMGGERLAGTSLAHAQAMLQQALAPHTVPERMPKTVLHTAPRKRSKAKHD